jgi:hypothetical protein
VLDEDGFFELIQKSPGKKSPASVGSAGDVAAVPPEAVKKRPASDDDGKMESSAKRVHQAPVMKDRGSAPASGGPSSTAALSTPPKTTTSNAPGTGSSLWTEKYRPAKLMHLVGNGAKVKRLSDWLQHWQENRKLERERAASGAGKGRAASSASGAAKDEDGSAFRAVLISGPPGIGKTTAVQVVCRDLGFEMIEFNASDTRSRKSMREEVIELTQSRTLFSCLHKPVAAHGQVLIMDEVDGMGAGDMGGIVELKDVISHSRVPVICMCNDKSLPKMRPLRSVTFDLSFERPTVQQIRARLKSILQFQEHVSIDDNALDEIINATNRDIRQVGADGRWRLLDGRRVCTYQSLVQALMVLSMWKLDAQHITYDDAKQQLTGGQVKTSQVNVFDAVRRLLDFEAGSLSVAVSVRISSCVFVFVIVRVLVCMERHEGVSVLVCLSTRECGDDNEEDDDYNDNHANNDDDDGDDDDDDDDDDDESMISRALFCGLMND